MLLTVQLGRRQCDNHHEPSVLWLPVCSLFRNKMLWFTLFIHRKTRTFSVMRQDVLVYIFYTQKNENIRKLRIPYSNCLFVCACVHVCVYMCACVGACVCVGVRAGVCVLLQVSRKARVSHGRQPVWSPQCWWFTHTRRSSPLLWRSWSTLPDWTTARWADSRSLSFCWSLCACLPDCLPA